VPVAYAGVESETAVVQTGLGLADVSAFAKLSCLGAGITRLVQMLQGGGSGPSVRGVGTLPIPGRGLACRLTDEHLFLIARTADPAPLRQAHRNLPAELAVTETDATSAFAGFCLVGRDGEALLRRLTALDLSAALPAGSCAETGLAGVHALLVRPPEEFPPAFHVYAAWDLAEYLWERILDAGRPSGVVPLGWEALGVLGLASS
jgi:aminomethyltransferase